MVILKYYTYKTTSCTAIMNVHYKIVNEFGILMCILIYAVLLCLVHTDAHTQRTYTTNCHYYHHNHHQLPLYSSQPPLSLSMIIV